jgi:hypothetical protein
LALAPIGAAAEWEAGVGAAGLANAPDLVAISHRPCPGDRLARRYGTINVGEHTVSAAGTSLRHTCAGRPDAWLPKLADQVDRSGLP